MDDITKTFLEVLCRACGAVSACIHARVSMAGEEMTVLKHRHDTACPESGQCPWAGRQILFTLLESPARRPDRVLAEDVLAPPGSKGYPDTAPEFIFNPPSGWEIASLEKDLWRFSMAREDLLIDLVLGLRQIEARRLRESIETAGSFLELAEKIVLLSGIEAAIRGIGREAEAAAGQCEQPVFDPPMYGISDGIACLRDAIRKVSVSSVPVLIEGENGTGKEIVARNIHRMGSRSDKSLVIVNCMEMPATLLQGELFGHMKGSFTGALRDRRGLMESAAGGTFFLDEIGEMPLNLQAALLRVIQEKEIRRLGENAMRPVDVRFVFATNRNLGELVSKGRFREDLYFRIKGIRLIVPALRHRRNDILILASRLLENASKAEGRRTPAITASAARRLVAYGWPGNVRELKNEMERIVALYPGAERIDPEMLSFFSDDAGREAEPGPGEATGTLPGAVKVLERRMIVDALQRFSGNRTRTASQLGITRQGLLKKIKRYGMLDVKGA